jgi:hypothetical protein
MQDVDVREQQGEQLAPASRIALSQVATRSVSGSSTGPSATDSVSSLRMPSSRSRSAWYFSAVQCPQRRRELEARMSFDDHNPTGWLAEVLERRRKRQI